MAYGNDFFLGQFVKFIYFRDKVCLEGARKKEHRKKIPATSCGCKTALNKHGHSRSSSS